MGDSILPGTLLFGGGLVYQPNADADQHQRPQILPPEQRLPIDEGAEQDVHHRVHEPEDGDPADGVVLHQQGPDDVARAADEGQRQQVQHAEHRPVFQPSAQNSAQQEQGCTAHEQVHKADGKAVCPAGDGFIPGACQRKEDGGNEHVGYAPGAAAAVVAQRGDENARKADAAAQRLGRGHAVSFAIKEMGEDDPQKALGAVQDAPKGTGEQGNSAVEKGVLRCGLPQAQCTAFGQDLPFGHGGQPALQQQAAAQYQHTAQHEPHPCKAENGGRVSGVDGKEPVAQLDERKSRTPHGVAENGNDNGKGRCAEKPVQLFGAAQLCLHGSVDAAANGGVVAVEGDGAAAVSGVGSKDHALADILALQHGAGGQIADDADLLADQILRLEPLGNAGQDAALTLAVKHGQVEQLLALLQVLAGTHLGHAQLHLAEGVKVDLFLVGEINGALLSGGGGSSLFGFGLGLVGSLGSGLALLVLFLQVGDLLGHINAGEQGIALVDGVGLLHAVSSLAQVDVGSGQAQLIHHLGSGGGQVSVQQDACHTQCLAQVVEHALQTGLVGLILGQSPGSGLVDILVGALDHGKDLHQGLRNGQVIHVCSDLAQQLIDHGLQLRVDGLGASGLVDRAAEVFLAHGNGAAEQVAQVVGQVAVDAVDQGLVGEHAVVAKGNLTQQEVADGVHAVAVTQDHRVHNVAHRLGHLAAVHQQPAVAKHALGQRQIQSHQHGGPQDGVEAQDLLAHHVQVGGPELVVIVVGLVAVAQRGDIVAQRIDPDIHGVLGVKGNGDAPLDRGAGNTGVLQALLDKGDHLVLPALGLDELGVLLVELEQTVGVLAGLEEVGLLVGLVDLAAALGALAVHQLAVGPEALAGLAVVADVLALVDIALLIQLGEDLLAGLHMVVIGGADEAVIADIQQLPQILDGGNDPVNVLLGGHACIGGLVLDLLAMLIGAGQEHDFLALHPLEAGQRVAGHGGVTVADVQLVAGVVDGGRDVECVVFAHGG